MTPEPSTEAGKRAVRPYHNGGQPYPTAEVLAIEAEARASARATAEQLRVIIRRYYDYSPRIESPYEDWPAAWDLAMAEFIVAAFEVLPAKTTYTDAELAEEFGDHSDIYGAALDRAAAAEATPAEGVFDASDVVEGRMPL